MTVEVYDKLSKAILEYDLESAVELARSVVEAELDIHRAIDVTSKAVRQVGDRFGTGELFLPELIAAGNIASKVMPILTEQLSKQGEQTPSLGTVVIGTVYGDIHSIGKNIVATLLIVEGFMVYDVGVDVPAREFVDAARKVGADILGVSSLLTITAPEQKRVIELLKEEGLRKKIKVMVGGGAISQEFADRIGADGYGETAYEAVRLARRLIGK